MSNYYAYHHSSYHYHVVIITLEGEQEPRIYTDVSIADNYIQAKGREILRFRVDGTEVYWSEDYYNDEVGIFRNWKMIEYVFLDKYVEDMKAKLLKEQQHKEVEQ